MSIGSHEGNTERLHQYWVHGEGAAKIRWGLPGEPGDFDRCVLHLGKYIADPKGYLGAVTSPTTPRRACGRRSTRK